MTQLHNVMEQTATPISYGAAAVTVISGLTINEWGVVAGICIGVATFAVNWAYKHKTWKHLRSK